MLTENEQREMLERIAKEAFALLNPAIASVLGVDLSKDPNPIGATG